MKAIGRPFISSEKFSRTILEINSLSESFARDIFFIEIARPDHYLKKNLGDFSAQISLRNDLIRKHVGERRFIGCWQGLAVPQYLLLDGHHLNEQGHMELAKACIERIS